MLPQHLNGVLTVRLPFGFRYAQPPVCALHIPADIDARPSGKRAELLDSQLLYARFRIETSSGTEAHKARILFQSLKKIIDHSGNDVISTEPLIKGR